MSHADNDRVVGIDPGLRLTGFACIEGSPHRPALVEAGVFRLQPSGPTRPMEDRLAELADDLGDLLDRVRPGLVAVEGLFAHYKHPATAVVMGHARGVVLLGARRAGVPVVELKPAEVKRAITGHGAAAKHQIQVAVQGLFNLPELPTPPDVADALAIAVCGARRDMVQKAVGG
jgi:crossover junction endodeoxyribonuclease RuvC